MGVTLKETGPWYQNAIRKAKSFDDIINTFHMLFDNPLCLDNLREVREIKSYYAELKEVDFIRAYTLKRKMMKVPSGNFGTSDDLFKTAGLNPMEVRYDLDQVLEGSAFGKEIKETFVSDSNAELDEFEIIETSSKIAKLQNEIRYVNDEAQKTFIQIREKFDIRGKKIRQEYEDVLKARDTLVTKYYRKQIPEPEYREQREALRKIEKDLEQENAELVEKMAAEKDPLRELAMEAQGKYMKEIGEIQSEFLNRVRDSILQKSPVSEAQANDWANTQEITPVAERRLKRQGYSPEQVREDMAEFYRLTSGRLTKCKIITEGRQRACAHYDTISLGNPFNKRTLFHEMGHVLEQDPRFSLLAESFLAGRIKPGQKPVKLLKLCPGSNYEQDEVAFEDKFFHPYVGKYYKGQSASEVTSMGMQMFANPILAYKLFSTDPEMFNMMHGLMLNAPGFNELMENIEEVDKAKSEQARNESFFAEIDKRIGNKDVFVKFSNKIQIKPWARRLGGRPSVWRVYITDNSFPLKFKNKKMAHRFAYLVLIDKGNLSFARINSLENLVLNQQAPKWYKKAGDLIPEPEVKK